MEEKLTWANHCCTSGIPQCFTSSFKSKFIFTSLRSIPMYINVSQTQISRMGANLVCECIYCETRKFNLQGTISPSQSHELKNRNWCINVHTWVATVFMEFPFGFLTSKPCVFESELSSFTNCLHNSKWSMRWNSLIMAYNINHISLLWVAAQNW